jgi:hypothetical protein
LEFLYKRKAGGLTFGLIYSYIFQHFINEHGTVVRAFQYSLLLCLPIDLREQLGFVTIGYWYLLDGGCQEPTSPAFASRGELAMVGRVPIYDAVYDCF